MLIPHSQWTVAPLAAQGATELLQQAAWLAAELRHLFQVVQQVARQASVAAARAVALPVDLKAESVPWGRRSGRGERKTEGQMKII